MKESEEVWEPNWKIKAFRFFKEFERKIKYSIPRDAKIKDIKFRAKGITEIIYEKTEE